MSDMPGADSVMAGRFHDAEVSALHLVTPGPILTMELTLPYEYAAARRVRLSFMDVTDLELAGFNEQNAVFDITAQSDGAGVLIAVSSSYGLSGTFRCTSFREEALATG
jgi:hypothetical protein